MRQTAQSATRLLVVLTVAAGGAACHDAYDSLFLDPDKSTTARIEYVFTQALIDADFPIHYGEWYWQVYDNVAAWAQVSVTQNDVNLMRPVSDQWQNTWTNYYTQESVYDAILKDLKDASDALRTLAVVHPALATQDLLLKGDLTGWRRFANALRLRLAMRLSEVAPAKAQAIVQEILADSTTYPLVETNSQNVAWYMDPTWIYDHNSLGNRSRATSERPDKAWAPKLMLDMMVADSDPRHPILFDPVLDTIVRYAGLPSSPKDQQPPLDRTRYSRLDSLMFSHNDNFPGWVMTAAEVQFLKSEAYLRGWASGAPQAAYQNALDLSVAMYYDTYNRNSAVTPKIPLPTAAEMSAFKARPGVVYDGTLQRIA